MTKSRWIHVTENLIFCIILTLVMKQQIVATPVRCDTANGQLEYLQKNLEILILYATGSLILND